MATLTTAERDSLPESAFVFPGDRRYPIHDISHARNALARVAQNGTPAEQGKVKSAVYAKYPALKKSEDVSLEGELWKSDEHHLVYGTVLAPHRRDSQGDLIVKEDDIRSAAHRYLAESRESDIQHSVEKADGVTLVESAVAPHDMVIGGSPVTKGSWFAAYKITAPEVWARVQKGELTGFSIGGTGLRLPEEGALDAAVALGKAEAVEEAVAKAHLTNIRVNRVSLVDRAAVRDATHPNQPQTFLLYKRESATSPKGDQMSTIDKSALAPDVREALEKAEKDAADATAALEKARKETDDQRTARETAERERDARPVSKQDSTPEPINKDELPPAVRAALEKAERDAEEGREAVRKAQEKADQADALAKAERDQRVTREYIAKAETGELHGIPGAPAEVGLVMKSLAEAAPEAWETFQKSVLVPAAAQLRESALLKEAGVGGEGPPPESAVRKMQEKVAELRKSDPNLSQIEAMEQVRKSDPALQAELAKELGTGADPSLRDPAYR